MLALFAAVLATSNPAPLLEASVPWWERITVIVDDKGLQQSCKYQSSLSPSGAEECDKDMADSIPTSGAKGPSGVHSKLTFERRFSPGGKPDSGKLEPGDKLLGRQVLFLTIDSEGSITSCRVVATAGDMPPDYNCEQAKTEQFQAQASADSGAPRQAFMTVLAYGHMEQVA